jgi:hypothetical protein
MAVSAVAVESNHAVVTTVNVKETGDDDDICMLLGAFELGVSSMSCCVTLNMIAPAILQGSVDAGLWANEHTCSDDCVMTALATMESAEGPPFYVASLKQPFVDACSSGWSDELQAAYPATTMSPTAAPTAAPEEEDYDDVESDCLLGGALKVGVTTNACCDLLNNNAAPLVLGTLDVYVCCRASERGERERNSSDASAKGAGFTCERTAMRAKRVRQC